jgi:hypothetical protein
MNQKNRRKKQGLDLKQGLEKRNNKKEKKQRKESGKKKKNRERKRESVWVWVLADQNVLGCGYGSNISAVFNDTRAPLVHLNSIGVNSEKCRSNQTTSYKSVQLDLTRRWLSIVS